MTPTESENPQDFKKIKTIDTLSKLLPIGAVFIILCSSIKLVVYYQIFSITIADYLEIGEYATLFVDDILKYLAIFGLGIAIHLIDQFSRKKTTSESNDNPFLHSTKKIIWFFSVMAIIIVAVAVFISHTISFHEKLNAIKSGLLALISLTFIFALNTRYEFNYFYFIIYSLLVYTGMDGAMDGHKIIENDDKLNYEITIEGRKIYTDDCLHYIGKSKKYIFLYDLDSEESTIIPIEKVNEIKIVMKKK
jgi:hypothetical protein